jgi:hypothetical protein
VKRITAYRSQIMWLNKPRVQLHACAGNHSLDSKSWLILIFNFETKGRLVTDENINGKRLLGFGDFSEFQSVCDRTFHLFKIYWNHRGSWDQSIKKNK